MTKILKSLVKVRRSLYSLLVLLVMQSYTLIPSLYSLEGILDEVYASPVKITTGNHEGERSNGTYTSGNITQYSETDYIDFRFNVEATHGPTSGSVEVRFTGDDGTCTFFDDYFALGAVTAYGGGIVPNVSVVSGPTAADFGTSSGEWVVTLFVEYPTTFDHPAGGATVNYTLQLSDEAGDCNGSSQHSRLNPAGGTLEQSGQQNVPVPANQVIELPELTIIKNVLTGTANENQWCFTVSPSINGNSLFCINDATYGNNVDRVVIPNINIADNTSANYTITESGPAGYAFTSGSGTSCTFNGSTATATVTAATSATNATCTFNNSVNPSGLVIWKDVQGPNGEDVVDTSESFTVTLDNANPQIFTDGGSVTYSNISAGIHTIHETVVPTNYTAYALTDMNGVVLDADLSDGASVNVVEAGTTQVRVINRQKVGSLTVTKNVLAPDGTTEVVDNTSFSVTVTGPNNYSQQGTISENQSATFNNLVPGTYYVTETESNNYTRVGCSSEVVVVTSNDTNNTVNCVNVQKNATVNVYKDVIDYDNTNIIDSQEFTVNLNGTGDTSYTGQGTIEDTNLDLNAQTPHPFPVAPGTYALTEQAVAGFENMGCKVGLTGELNATTDLTLSSNQTVNVYCVNKVQVGDIVVTKYLQDPNGNGPVTNDSTVFTMVLDGNVAGGKGVTAGNSVTFPNLRVGTYTITEILPGNYDFVSFSQDADANTAGAQLVVTAGNTTNLTVTNKQQWATIYVTKDVRDPYGNDVNDITSFEVELKNAGMTVLDTGNIYEGMSPTATAFQVLPGYAHYVNEVVNTLYESKNCNNLSVPALASGATTSVECVNHQKFAELMVYKEMWNPLGEVITWDTTQFVIDLLVDGISFAGGTIAVGSPETFENLVPDDYSVVEVQVDPNYTYVSCEPTTVTLESGETDEVITCTNQQKYGSLTVYKDVINPNGNEVSDSTSFSVTLEGPFEYQNTPNYTTQYGTISEVSSHVFSNLLPGTYYLTETEDSNYDRLDCDTVQVVVESNETASMTCENQQKVAYINIYKDVKSPTGGEVSDNEEFTVTVYDASDDSVIYDNLVISENAPQLNLPVNPGTYYVTEYDNADYDEKGCGVSITLGSNQSTNNTFTCENWQNDATVIVYKDVINYDDEDIYDSTSFTVNLDGVNGSTDSDTGTIADVENQQGTVLNVEPGDYELTEESVFGYENMGCTVERGGSLTGLTSGSSVTVYCVNRVQVGDLVVFKDVVNPDGGPVNDTEEFTVTVTSSNGYYSQNTISEANLLGTLFENLLPGVYTVVETENPDYELDSYITDEDDTLDGAQVTVAPNEESTLTVVNKQKKATVTVIKEVYQGEDRSLTSSVEFQTEVRDLEGNLVEAENDGMISDTSDEKNNKVAEYALNPGMYNLTEVEQNGFNFEGCYVYYDERDLALVVDEEVPSHNVHVSSNEEITYVCYNELINPELELTKSNDKTGIDLFAGDTVNYTLYVKAPVTEEEVDESMVTISDHNNTYLLNEVVVTDLTPAGFTYINGTWSATKNGSPISVPEPTYGTSGKWYIGDMEEGDEVVLTYTAKIANTQDAGLYKDLAWVEGESLADERVLGASDDGFFAGTDVRVVNDIEEGEAEVLGVTLPDTGADMLLTLTAIISALIGMITILFAFGRKKMLKGALALAVVFAGVFSLSNPMNTYAATDLAVRVEQPKTPYNKQEMKLGFVALDVEGREVTATCMVNKPGAPDDFTTFGSPIVLPLGGGNGDCNLDATVLSAQGVYEFKVVASVTGDSAESTVVSMELDTTGPDTVKNYEKTKGVCTYTLSFTVANDAQSSKVQIFRSTERTFVADSSSIVTTINVTPNEEVEYTDTVPNCDLTYYYAVRAVDSADNSSDFVADTVVTVIPGEVVDGGDNGEVEGVDTDNGGNQGGNNNGGNNSGNDNDDDNGEVKGDEDEDKDNGKGDDKDGESTLWDWLKYVLPIVGVVVLGGVVYVYVKNRKAQNSVK